MAGQKDMDYADYSGDTKNPKDYPGGKKSPLDKSGSAKGQNYKGPGSLNGKNGGQSFASDNPLNSGGNKLHKSAEKTTSKDYGANGSRKK